MTEPTAAVATTRPKSITEHNKDLVYGKREMFLEAWGGDVSKNKRFVLAASNAINADPKLQKCTDQSKLDCLLQLCQWKLMPGKALGHVFLVPFKDQCTILVGYKGYVHLAYRSGLPTWMQSEVVYEKDDVFEYTLGDTPTLRHVKAETRMRGKRRGVYLIIQFKGADKFVDYMTADEIAPIKEFALKNADGFSPWKGEFEDEMWKKSIIRRDAKRLALGEILEQVSSYESERESLLAEINRAASGGDDENDGRSKSERLASRMEIQQAD